MSLKRDQTAASLITYQLIFVTSAIYFFIARNFKISESRENLIEITPDRYAVSTASETKIKNNCLRIRNTVVFDVILLETSPSFQIFKYKFKFRCY